MDLPTHFDEIESRLTSSISETMLDLADVRPGSRVLDLASGRGEPSLRAAERAGTSGYVLGVDPWEAAIQAARARARERGLTNVEYVVGDAESVDRADEFDACTARWALMGMASPVRALSAARRALRPGGVLVAAFWAEPERIPWWSLPRRVTARFVELPPVAPDAPSAIRYASAERIARDLTSAGFRLESSEERETAVVEGDGAEIARWAEMVFGRWLAALKPDELQRWRGELALEVQAHRAGSPLSLGGVTRIVVARRE